MNIVPLIMAGGIGERFWPLSRSSRPKQLQTLTTGCRTMIEETIARVRPLCGKKVRPLIIAGASIAPKIKKLPGCDKTDLIAEPVGKNTAPAVMLGAAYIEQQAGESIMLVVSADHAIKPVTLFRNTVKQAAHIAHRGDRLVVFGIRPTRPEQGYGYLQLGPRLEKEEGTGYRVKRFVEKPDASRAARYVASRSYLWNSGMFVWKTSVILEECAEHMPDLYRAVQKVVTARFSTAAIRRFYNDVSKESIDFGIMEHSRRVAAIRAEFTWDDIGSWESMSRIHRTDPLQTVSVGSRVFSRENSECIIFNDSGRALAAIGLDQIVLVATKDAVLAIDRRKVPDIKKYLASMKSHPGFPSSLF